MSAQRLPKLLVVSRTSMRALRSLPLHLKLVQKNGELQVFHWRAFKGIASLSALAAVELRFWLAHVWRLCACTLVCTLEVDVFRNLALKSILQHLGSPQQNVSISPVPTSLARFLAVCLALM